MDAAAIGVDGDVALGNQRLRPERGHEPLGAVRGCVHERAIAGRLGRVEQPLPVEHERKVDERLRAKVADWELVHALLDILPRAGHPQVKPLRVVREPVQGECILEGHAVTVAARVTGQALVVDEEIRERGRAALGHCERAGEGRRTVQPHRAVEPTGFGGDRHERARVRKHCLQRGPGETFVERLVAGQQVVAHVGERRRVDGHVAPFDVPRCLGSLIPPGRVAQQVEQVECGVGERALRGPAVIVHAEERRDDALERCIPVARLEPHVEARGHRLARLDFRLRPA